MPELPEVERVRMSLARRAPGRRAVSVGIWRKDVVRGEATPGALLAGDRVADVRRHGKQLALVGESGRCVCVHLGMTGSLCWGERDRATEGPSDQGQGQGRVPSVPGSLGPSVPSDHVHITWAFDDGGSLRFRDPRRFGGVWTFPSVDALHRQRWGLLGDDALRVTPTRLHRRLQGTRRALKAALLDQHLVAGLGNIYVDELLFACGLSPGRRSDTVGVNEVRKLVRRMRTLLTRAVDAGGSSLRDYVDGDGVAGGFQGLHKVYGRGGAACRRCRAVLATAVVAGRTTVFCERCQKGTWA